MLRTAISVKIKGPRKPLKPTLLKRKNFHVNNIDLFAVISEVNMVGGNTKPRWVDTGATRHVCLERKCFLYIILWVIEEKFSWEIPQPLKLELERLCSK